MINALAVVMQLDRVLFANFEALERELLNFLSEVVSPRFVAVELLVEFTQSVCRRQTEEPLLAQLLEALGLRGPTLSRHALMIMKTPSSRS